MSKYHIVGNHMSPLLCCFLCVNAHTRVSQKKLRVDSYLLRRLTYTSKICHMLAMNCPASEYAIYKTMKSIDSCCLATKEYEITPCVHAGI